MWFNGSENEANLVEVFRLGYGYLEFEKDLIKLNLKAGSALTLLTQPSILTQPSNKDCLCGVNNIII